MKGSQLPQVNAELGLWLNAMRGCGEAALNSSLGFTVEKARLGEDGQYILSGDRYRENRAHQQSQYPMVPLGDVVDILDSKRRPITKHDRDPGPYPYYGATGVLDHVADYIFDEPLVLLGEDGAKWGPRERSAFSILGKTWVNNHAHVIRPKRDRLLDDYLIELLNLADLMPFITGVTVPKLNQQKMREIQIPVPPLEVQREIVAEIQGYKKVIDGARAVLKNYRPHIAIDPAWPMVKLGEIVERLNSGVSVNSENREILPGEKGILKTSCVTLGIFDPSEHKAILPGEVERAKCSPKADSIIISRMNTEALVGASAYVDADFPNLYLPDRLWQTVITREDVVVRFIHQILASSAYRAKISAVCGGTSGSMKNISKPALLGLEVPLPPVETQQAIVAEIEAEQALVAANRELIARFEAKIEAVIARVWGGVEAAPAVEAAA